MDVIPVHAVTSFATIEKLRIVFATQGLLKRIVTGNGTVFTSDEFDGFLKSVNCSLLTHSGQGDMELCMCV